MYSLVYMTDPLEKLGGFSRKKTLLMYIRINEKKLYNKYQIVLILLSKGEDKIGTDRKDKSNPCLQKQTISSWIRSLLLGFLPSSFGLGFWRLLSNARLQLRNHLPDVLENGLS